MRWPSPEAERPAAPPLFSTRGRAGEKVANAWCDFTRRVPRVRRDRTSGSRPETEPGAADIANGAEGEPGCAATAERPRPGARGSVCRGARLALMIWVFAGGLSRHHRVDVASWSTVGLVVVLTVAAFVEQVWWCCIRNRRRSWSRRATRPGVRAVGRHDARGDPVARCLPSAMSIHYRVSPAHCRNRSAVSGTASAGRPRRFVGA